MVMLVISTQYRENYGTDTDPFWKSKGGNDYKILGVPLNVDYEAIVSASGIGYSNAYSEEYVIGWSIENDDYLSWFERSQLEHEGSIRFPESTMEYSDLLATME